MPSGVQATERGVGTRQTMKAIRHTVYGAPEVLRLCEVPRPVPRDDEVLIRIRASTVNRSDGASRAADPFLMRFFNGLLVPRQHGSGTEFSGDIAAVGSRVTLFNVGDAVFGRAPDERPGTHAQFYCMPETGAIALKPASLPYEDAAAICDGAMLAGMYIRLIDVARFPRIIVNGASGAIGSAAVQLAKLKGATVTAVCKTDAIDRVSALGADRVIDYTTTDFTQLRDPVDVVFDAVGKSTSGRCRRVLRDGGIYMSTELGPWGQNPLLALKTKLFGGRISVHFPIPVYSQQEAQVLKQLVEDGTYRPLIDRIYPMDEIVEAARYVDAGEKVGNVVLRVATGPAT